MESNYLFSTTDGLNAVQHQKLAAGIAVDQLSEQQILNIDIEELVQYFVDKFDVTVPKLDLENVLASRSEAIIEVYDYARIINVPGVIFTFEIPFEGDAKIFKMRPSTYSSSGPVGQVRGNILSFQISGRELTEDQLKQGFERNRDSIIQYLEWHKSMWGGIKGEIANIVRDKIITRKERLDQQIGLASTLSNIGIKLKENPNDPGSYRPSLVKAKIEPKMPPMKPSVPPDPSLDQETYEKILGLIRDAGRSIEQSSSRMRSLDEEALRDIMLVPLNAHFGSATGEAFNFNGKTDILIKHEGSNIFAAECKIWRGDKELSAAIDQLLSYLTWRDTKVALIVFNRNKDFSTVVEKLKNIPKSHPCYVSGPTRLDDTSIQFKMKLPHDSARFLTLSILAFDLGEGKTS